MQGMTRRERQVTDPERILQILDTAKVLHLGLAVDNEPYVVPMNYGYAMVDGKLTLYLHSAHSGKKLDMMRANPNVFFEMESGLVPFEGDVACRYGLAYSCLMGRGRAQKVEDVSEKKLALELLMKVQTGRDFSFTDKLTDAVTITRIDVSEYTAKCRPLPDMR